MKRFDLANEVAKQLITISAAIITLVVTFYDKFISHSTLTFSVVLAALLLFILSIIAGILSIGGLVVLAEKEEKQNFLAGQGLRNPEDFVGLRGGGAQIYAKLQQLLFACGLVLFIFVAIANYATSSDDTKSTNGASPVVQQSAAKAQSPIVWVQLRPDEAGVDGQMIARAIVSPGDDCPAARLYDGGWFGTSAKMEVRWKGAEPDFPIKICELTYPGIYSARIGDVQFDPRPKNPRRILVIGDSGCRLTHYEAQPCNRPADWPFAAIAAAAKDQQPDLIIHLGDYHYREKPCAGRPGCDGLGYGDNWPVWQAEFFAPAAPLLSSAPWVMMRGNHENCLRAGAGWMLLLSPQPDNPAALRCVDDTPPYELGFDRLTLAVFDTANAEDSYNRTKRSKTYADYITNFAPRVSRSAKPDAREHWLLLHQPLWSSYGNDTETDLFSELQKSISTPASPALNALIERLRGEIQRPIHTFRNWFDGAPPFETLSPNVSLVLSGDTHLFELFRPQDRKLPVQLVAGTSGDTLEKKDAFQQLVANSPADVNLFGIEGQLWTHHGFGFVLVTADDGVWTARYHDVTGKARLTCSLKRAIADPEPALCERQN